MSHRMKPALRVTLAPTPTPKAPWFQIHLSTSLAMMFAGALLVPTLMRAWENRGFGITLLICLNLLMLVAMVCEYLIRNTRRRWNDPPTKA